MKKFFKYKTLKSRKCQTKSDEPYPYIYYDVRSHYLSLRSLTWDSNWVNYTRLGERSLRSISWLEIYVYRNS